VWRWRTQGKEPHFLSCASEWAKKGGGGFSHSNLAGVLQKSLRPGGEGRRADRKVRGIYKKECFGFGSGQGESGGWKRTLTRGLVGENTRNDGKDLKFRRKNISPNGRTMLGGMLSSSFQKKERGKKPGNEKKEPPRVGGKT